MTTPDYVQAVARYWWLVVVGALLGLLTPSLLLWAAPPGFAATTIVSLQGNPTRQTTSAETSQLVILAQQRIPTYSELADGPTLAQAVVDSGALDLTIDEVVDDIDVTVQGTSTDLHVTATSPDADQAEALSAQAADSLVTLVNEAEKSQIDADPMLRAAVVLPAGDAVAQTSSGWRNPALGLAAGLLVGVAAAVGAARLDPRLQSAGELRSIFGAPVLGTVGRGRPGRGARAGHRVGAVTDATAQRQALRTSVALRWREHGSPLRVCVVGADRTGSRAAGVATDLADDLVSAGTTALLAPREVELRVTDPAVTLVPLDADEAVTRAGTAGPCSTALAALPDRPDLVVVVAPALSEDLEAVAVATDCDGAVVVVPPGSRASVVRAQAEALRDHAVPVIAVVVAS